MIGEDNRPSYDSIKEDSRMHAFKTTAIEKEKTIKNNENEEKENSDSVITFGEELDVPAFIRNRRE